MTMVGLIKLMDVYTVGRFFFVIFYKQYNFSDALFTFLHMSPNMKAMIAL